MPTFAKIISNISFPIRNTWLFVNKNISIFEEILGTTW